MARDSTSSFDSLAGEGGPRNATLGVLLIAGLNVFGAVLVLPLLRRLWATSDPVAMGVAALVAAVVLVGLVLTYGLVTMRHWGLIGTILFNVVSAVANVATANLGGLLVNALIVGYLVSIEEQFEPA